MSGVGFEPTILAGQRPQTYALDRAANGIGYHDDDYENLSSTWQKYADVTGSLLPLRRYSTSQDRYNNDDDDDDDNNNNNNKKDKTCTLIDVAIPADRNVVQKEVEKKLKYKSLCIEMQRIWNLKCTIVPVIIGATGIVTRSLKKNLETIAGKHSIDSLQKTAILGTSHIIRKVLQCEA